MRNVKYVMTIMVAFIGLTVLLSRTNPPVTADNGFTSISDIQFTMADPADSPLDEMNVSIQGIVYAVYFNGFALADAVGAWNGIFVYTDNAPTVVVGDEVQVTGVVDEFFGRTSIGDSGSSPTVNVISSGNAVYAATEVSTGDIATGASTAEAYEGVFVEVSDVTVTDENPDDPSDFGEWVVDDGSGGARVDDLAYDYAAVLDEELAAVRGMLTYSFSNFKIEPRDADDVVDDSEAGITSIYDIQFTMDTPADSPLDETVVTLKGVVYAVYFNGFAVADAAGAWNGIFVYTNDSPTVVQGDEVEVTGIVDEFFGRTSIGDSDNTPTVNILSSDNDPYPATQLSTGEIGTDASTAESYEGVLVEVSDVTVTNENPDDPSNFGEWAVDDGSGEVRVDDLGYAYNALLNEELSIVRGMLTYSFSNFKIEPRDADDVVSGGSGEMVICGDPATLIHAVQGVGNDGSMEGTTGVEIEGVVVGDFQSTADELSGFYLQEEDTDIDANPLTSEGVFVYDNGFGVDVAVGDVVRVKGTVSEFFDNTQISSVVAVQPCETTGTATPATISFPVDSVDGYEAFEGMAVSLTDTLYVTEHYNLGRYGELHVSALDRLYNPTQVQLPGEDAASQLDLNNRSRIMIDDGSRIQNPDIVPYLAADNTVRGGDTVMGINGVMDYAFSEYRIQPTEMFTPTRTNERTDSPDDVGGSLTVAAFNVLNYFTTIDDGSEICGANMDLGCRGADSEEEFTRQRTKIIEALAAMDADIVGLIEIENNATDSLLDLVEGLNNLLGDEVYDYVDTGTIGTDAIKVGFIYKFANVSPDGIFAVLDSSVDPDFIDTKNRPALAQTFVEVETGETFTAVINHFKSKGSACDDVDDPNLDDGQGNCNGTRTKAAIALHEWLATDPTGSEDPDMLILGDLNAYAMEDPIMALKDAGYADLLEESVGMRRYSYVFDGEWGTLDYGLANESLLEQVTGATSWHINADEPRNLDYNEEFNPPYLYQPDKFRASDHDPIIVGLDLSTEHTIFMPIIMNQQP